LSIWLLVVVVVVVITSLMFLFPLAAAAVRFFLEALPLLVEPLTLSRLVVVVLVVLPLWMVKRVRLVLLTP
jgi:hypothetical protein